MKKLYFLFSFSVFSLAALAQNPVPNPDFESWTGSTPNNWSVVSAANTVTKETPGYGSASAAKLTAVATSVVPILTSANNGFAVSHGYSNLELWYKASFVGSDVCNISVSFLDGSNQTIGAGSKAVGTSTSTFTHVIVPITITGTPVKCQIIFTVINPNGGIVVVNQGSTITIDNVQLTGVIGIDELKDGSDLVVYPNPVQNLLQMQVTTTPGEKITWKLTDLSGRLVAQKQSGNYSAAQLKDEMILPDLSTGLYIFSMESDIRRATRRVVVE